MLKIKSLQQRLMIFLLLPVTVFLAGIGAVGYVYIRDSLLKEWQDAAILRLERAAHQMDMRLMEPRQLMESLARPGEGRRSGEHQQWVVQQLQAHPGVSRASLVWAREAALQRVAAVSEPQYFYPEDHKTVGLKSDLLDEAGNSLGRLEVNMKLDYLMQDVLTSGWLQSHMACLISREGQYLAHSDPSMEKRHCLGETQNPLELSMRSDLQEKPFGTILGREEVIGFYRLHTAPWAIMLHAQAHEILAPIRSFRLYYMGGGFLCLLALLVLIRQGVHPLVTAIRRISHKAALVADGEYGESLEVTTQDEIGQLTHSFNDMVAGLKERDFISNTFGRYVDPEIARELLSRPEASRLGGEKRQVVILFSDIRGFTPLAETLSPEATIHLVNRHFSRMIEVIQAHRGIIVDFLGDALLAFFDPLDGPLAPKVREALRCALKMQAAQEEENIAAPHYPPLHLGIGLHVGEAVVGNIGSESRAKYGIMGAAVNLTHRIQGQAQVGEVVISEAVYSQVRQDLVVKKEFQTSLKGIQEPVRLYLVEKLQAAAVGED